MSSAPYRVHFLTFGGGLTWPDAARRLSGQAKRANLFDRVVTETSETFFKRHSEFARHRPFIEANPRGWGYWIWKPFLILKHLKRLNAGDVLLYLDAGCEILPENSEKLRSMLDFTRQTGALFFDYAHFPAFNAPFWTKQSLLSQIEREFGLSDTLRLPTVWAGGLALAKTPRNIAFLEDWLRYCIAFDYHFVNDTPSLEPARYPIFEHRHDQAVMTLLKAAYQLPSYGSAAAIDFHESVGEDYAAVVFAQPFLSYRNPEGVSRVEQAKRSPGPVGTTKATHFLAQKLEHEHLDILKALGVVA